MGKKCWISVFVLSACVCAGGCSPAQNLTRSGRAIDELPLTTRSDDELALTHFIEGSLLDQIGKYAEAILQYQEALQNKQDAAIYHAIAKDYSILKNHQRAVQMGLEAVRLAPKNRTYHETLAEIYVSALDLESALREYQAVIGLDSTYLEAWLSLARLLQLQKPAKALQIYEQVLDRFGPEADAYFQMAQIYNNQGDNRKAAEALKGMLALDPGNFEIKKALGDAYLRCDSAGAALQIYHELVEVHPENLELRAAMAHVYLTRQDYDAAAEQFDSVLRRDTLSLDDQLRFGEVFLSFIQKDSLVAPYAIKLFERIQKTYPKDWRPYWFLGGLDNIIRDDSGAFKNFEKVKQFASWNPDGWVGIAWVYYNRGRFDDAIQVLNEAMKVIPGEYRIFFLLGVSYQRKHQLNEAAASLERAVQLNEKSVDGLSALGLVYDELKRPEESDTIYEHALRLEPHNHLILNNYAYSLAVRGVQLDRALRMAKEAIDQEPTNQSYLDTYGWVYFRLERYDEAERYVRKAIELGSTSAVVHEHLGDIYFKMSRKDKALELWQKALELDATNAELKEKIQRGSL